jgi:hypothetical protein
MFYALPSDLNPQPSCFQSLGMARHLQHLMHNSQGLRRNSAGCAPDSRECGPLESPKRTPRTSTATRSSPATRFGCAESFFGVAKRLLNAERKLFWQEVSIHPVRCLHLWRAADGLQWHAHGPNNVPACNCCPFCLFKLAGEQRARGSGLSRLSRNSVRRAVRPFNPELIG